MHRNTEIHFLNTKLSLWTSIIGKISKCAMKQMVSGAVIIIGVWGETSQQCSGYDKNITYRSRFIFFKGKIPNISLLQVCKCEIPLLFSVIFDSKLKMFEIETNGQDFCEISVRMPLIKLNSSIS